jgi:hypothetical protein
MLDGTNNNLIFNPGFFSPRVEKIESTEELDYLEPTVSTPKYGRKVNVSPRQIRAYTQMQSSPKPPLRLQ